MNNLDKKYTDLLQDILDNGIQKGDRTGTGTISVFGRQIRHKMSEGFPLLTTKKMAWNSVVTELLWFLRGDTNIKFLLDYDCHIWDGDAYKRYYTEWSKSVPGDGTFNSNEYSSPSKYEVCNFTKEEFISNIKTDDEFAKRWGELGPIYGKQWRSWGSSFIDDLGDVYTNEVDYDIQNGRLPYDSSNRKFVIDTIKKHNPRIDQISNLINELKTNPDSRRLIVSAWNVGELDKMVLPPCHYGFQVYTRELSWYDDLDKIKEIYVNWSLAKSSGGYAGDIKADTIESANQIFVNGWQNNKDPYTGKPLIELECFSSIPKRAISLMWNQRSVDTFLGLPFNIASYGLLLEIIAKEVNMIPDELIGNLGDVHLYKNHIEQAKEQIGRKLTFDERYKLLSGSDKTWEEGGGNSYGKINGLDMMDDAGIPTRTRQPFELPKLEILDSKVDNISHYEINDFVLKNYQSHPAIKAPLSN